MSLTSRNESFAKILRSNYPKKSDISWGYLCIERVKPPVRGAERTTVRGPFRGPPLVHTQSTEGLVRAPLL